MREIETLPYTASFLAFLVSLGFGIGLAYTIPRDVTYYAVFVWAVITPFAFLGLEFMFRMEVGRSLLSVLGTSGR